MLWDLLATKVSCFLSIALIHFVVSIFFVVSREAISSSFSSPCSSCADTVTQGRNSDAALHPCLLSFISLFSLAKMKAGLRMENKMGEMMSYFSFPPGNFTKHFYRELEIVVCRLLVYYCVCLPAMVMKTDNNGNNEYCSKTNIDDAILMLYA